MNKDYLFDLWTPLFECIDNIVKPVTQDEIFNPLYPCHLKWRCKASRKKLCKK